MGLPNQLKAARMTSATQIAQIDDSVNAVEQAICDITGVPIDTQILESVFGAIDTKGRGQRLRISGADSVNGVWIRDTTASKELRVGCAGGKLKVWLNTGTDDTPVWVEKAALDLTTGIWETGLGLADSYWASYGDFNPATATWYYTVPGLSGPRQYWARTGTWTWSSANSCLVPPEAGYYFIHATARFVQNATGGRKMKLASLLSSSLDVTLEVPAQASFSTGITAHHVLELGSAVNQGLQVGLYQDSGSALQCSVALTVMRAPH